MAIDQGRLRLAFFGFAVLIAGRDIFYETRFKEGPTTFAFWIAATITLASAAILVKKGSFRGLLAKVSQPGIRWRVGVVGALAAAIYWLTFAMIGKLGAGDFNLVDYGLSPLLTACVGFAFFAGERPRAAILLAFALYLSGLWMMVEHQKPNLEFLFLAMVSSLATAVSDGLAKWLLGDERLSRPELMFLRFAPACPVLFAAALMTGDGWQLRTWPVSLPVVILCGFVPMWLLYSALGHAALNRYAIWEFLIPAAAFLGTLPWHPEHWHKLPITGSVLIVLGLLANETNGFEFLLRRNADAAVPTV
jgi:drug/metabolite transporter (DMT)-like permease